MGFLKIRALFLFMILPVLAGCNYIPMRLLWLKNMDPEERGVSLEFRKVPRGLWERPVIEDYGALLKVFSDNAIDIDALNAYTVGNYDEYDTAVHLPGVTNFLNPRSKYKDSWFGVYIVFDDPAGRGRKFMLADPKGSPADPGNISAGALAALSSMDQRIIVWSSHKNHVNYTMKKMKRRFFFTLREGAEIRKSLVTDRQKREWLRIYGEFETQSAVTDVKKTDMGRFNSIRAFIGMPDREVYRMVDPWHPITVKGVINARYFDCGAAGFWAAVYYNGSQFVTLQGSTVDTWTGTDLPSVYEELFNNLLLDCGGRQPEK